jgi:ABC-type xylose transport system permease subunit
MCIRCMIDHAQMMGLTMTDRIEILVVAVTGALLGTITGYELGHERLGILVWALAGAVVVSGIVYCLRFFRY